MSLRTRLTLGVLGAVLATTTGCGPTMQDIPVPGTGVSGDTMNVSFDFNDALNLAQGAPVKVNGVTEGKVDDITAHDFHARAATTIKTDADLREGATARLRYTTPLGELYVDISNPSTGAKIHDGKLFTAQQTSTAATVEDTLSEASLLINGGGLGSLQTITEELNAALGGNEGTIRDLLNQTNTFLTQVNATTGDIDRALHALDGTAQTLARRKDTIHRALKEIAPAASVLREATPNFTHLLQELRKFAKQANSTMDATQDELLATIREAEPVLRELAANRGRWDHSLRELVTLAHALHRAMPGDYLNITLDLHVALQDLLASTGAKSQTSAPAKSAPSGGSSGGGTPDLLGGVTKALGGN